MEFVYIMCFFEFLVNAKFTVCLVSPLVLEWINVYKLKCYISVVEGGS